MVKMKRNSAIDLREGIFVEVRVASIVHKNIWKTAERFVERNTSMRDLQTITTALAGTAAELLCMQYNDPIDPSECVKKALEGLKKMITAFDESDMVTLTNGVTIP